MQKTISLLAFAAVVAQAAPAVDRPTIQNITYGGATPPPTDGLWTPISKSYSNGQYKQAIFLSFDGLHQFDLVDYVAKYPNSTWASILKNSVAYSNARASSPSDSFPATTALFTGASPRDSGIWWDDVWDRSLYLPSSNCTGPIGTECDWSEAVDLNPKLLSGGGAFNLSALPMQKTAWGTCEVVYPHNFIRVNTVFEVGRGNGLVTAYADKHPTYEFLNGPSGVGLSQGYFPEVSSVGNNITAQEAWDDLHCKSFCFSASSQAERLAHLSQGLPSATGLTATSPMAPKTPKVAPPSMVPISRQSPGHSPRGATSMPMARSLTAPSKTLSRSPTAASALSSRTSRPQESSTARFSSSARSKAKAP